MKKHTLALALFLTIGIFAVAALSQTQELSGTEDYSWRYRMTVTVETPEGDVSGSAVRQMGNELSASPLSQNGNPADVKGEAVVVDLGKRGMLFALISHQSDLEFYTAFRKLWPKGGATPEGIRFYAALPAGTKATLPPEKEPGYPKLVTFTDINDPKSVTLAQIWERQKFGGFALKQDRMEELFGQGVKLKNITLEITDEPVTWGIKKQLPWLPEFYNKRLDGNRYGTIKATNKTANALSSGSFSTGEQ